MLKKLAAFIFGILLSFGVFALELKKGDLLLQSLRCYVCNLIEAETNSPYSHIGIVLFKNNKPYVLEAFSNVAIVPLKEFLSKSKKNITVKVLRHKALRDSEYYGLNAFAQNIEGNPYNKSYRFNNYINGKKSYYCSELVYEYLKEITNFIPHPTPMPFKINPDLWDKHFQGDTPRGELGISPEDFNDETYFDVIGYL